MPTRMRANTDRIAVTPVIVSRSSRIVAFCALLVLAACASVTPRIEAPQVTLESVRVEGRAELSVGLKLSNPNAEALAIKAIDYEITLDNRPAATGRTTRVDMLPAGGEGRVDIAGRVDVGAVATAMMALGSQLPVAYTLKGTVSVQDWAPIAFSRSGKIAVSKFDSGFGSGLR
jgi:LEA14-like dessication related protein